MFTFKKITEQDIPLLFRWLKEPHVAQWWPTLEEDEVIEHFLKRIRSEDTFGYIVFLNDMPLGYIQYYLIDRASEKTGAYFPELPKNSVGTDQFIGEKDYISKGYGTLFIKAFIEYLKTIEPTMSAIVVDPDPTNVPAIRCYEKVGFRTMGIHNTSYGEALFMKYDL